MKRIYDWARWVESNLSMEIDLIHSIDHPLVEAGLVTPSAKGSYYNSARRCWVKLYGRTEREALKTLFHELGHHLVELGWAGKIQTLTPKEFKTLISSSWIETYSLEEKEEEVLVESFALWALSLYTEGGGIHPEVKLLLKDIALAIS